MIFNKQTRRNTAETAYRAFTLQQSLTIEAYIWNREESTIAFKVRGTKGSVLIYSNFNTSYHLLLIDAMFNNSIDSFWLENIHINLPLIHPTDITA